MIQLHGEGPWEIIYLNPSDDPRNKSNQEPGRSIYTSWRVRLEPTTAIDYLRLSSVGRGELPLPLEL